MEEQEVDYMHQLEGELQEADKERRQLAKAQLGMYENGNIEDNLVKWQLNLEEEKERIYHLLKGHRKGYNEKGEEVWMPPESEKSIILNDVGVDYIMGLLEAFLNRNIILSNWDDERIMELLNDLSSQIINDIYNSYEDFGLDTDFKRKMFGILVEKVIINVEAAFRRGLNNGERRSLRAIMTITQNETPNRGYQNYPVMQQQPQRRSVFRPSTWGG